MPDQNDVRTPGEPDAAGPTEQANADLAATEALEPFARQLADEIHDQVAPPTPDEVDRRGFLTRVTLGLTGLIGLLVALPPLAYLLAPLVESVREEWRDLGPLDTFPVGTIRLASFEEISPLPWAGQTARTAAWVRRTADQEFTVFAITCTHLGCPVNWVESAELFICPCHGGVYYQTGQVAAGPPPHALWEYEHRVQNDVLQILTNPLPAVRPPAGSRL